LPLIVVDQNRLAEVSNGGNILGFRAYFQLEKELAPGTKVGISARKPTPTNVITIDGKRVNIEKFLREGRVYIRVGDSLIYYHRRESGIVCFENASKLLFPEKCSPSWGAFFCDVWWRKNMFYKIIKPRNSAESGKKKQFPQSFIVYVKKILYLCSGNLKGIFLC
jgi:hypothetical protein